MNLKYTYIITAFIALLIFLKNTEIAQSAGVAQIKTMTVNTGPKSGTSQEKNEEALTIANFVKNNAVEIFSLQGRTYTTATDNDKIVFENAFTSIGYPMNIFQVTETPNEANMIFSKYPFITGSSSEFVVNPSRNRITQRIAIQTPYGKLWVINAHTDAARSCSDAISIFDKIIDTSSPIYIPTGEDAVVMGYFNLTLSGASGVASCEDPALVPVINSKLPLFKTTCTNAASCVMSDNPSQQNWIMTVQSAQTTLNSVLVSTGLDDISETRSAIIAVIESTNFVVPPDPPTATPTLTPTPSPPGGAGAGLTITKTRPMLEEMSSYDNNRWDDLMYYVVFSLGYLTLIRFGFYIHRFFSFFLLTLVFISGLGITFAFGLPAGLFVVIMGSFMIMMQ